MTIWIGIDEVGYGPRLGPLVLGLYSLRGSGYNESFWDQAGLESDPRKWREELVVCDSKELYKSKSGIKRLETSALILSPNSGCFSEWLNKAGNMMHGEVSQYPWYKEEFDLPIEAFPEVLQSHRAKYQKTLKEQKVSIGHTIIRPVLERRFNSMLKSHNKSRLEFEEIMRILDQVMSMDPEETFFVDVDKLGGRDRYAEVLSSYFPMQQIEILYESRNKSHYSIPGRKLEIRFMKGADQKSFPVAAASILAKYTRELFMLNLNNYWCERIEGLTPTAGYPEDAKRFMYVVKPELLAAGYSESWMVREK